MIITRAFRATGVGIDVDGIQKQHQRDSLSTPPPPSPKILDFEGGLYLVNPSDIIFPNFQTYVAPEKSEVHNDDPLTEAEVKALADAKQAFQKAQKERLEAERKEAKRQRSIARINKL